MKKFFKYLLFALSAIVLLLVAAALILPRVLDPNDYKEQIAAKVREATGRELDIQGDIRLSFFPWVGVEVGTARLGNAPGFGQQPMLAVESVDVKVRLLPLVQKKLVMKTIVLHAPEILLERDSNGTGNWEDLGGGQKTPPEPASPQPPEGQEGGLPLEEVRIQGLSVKQAELVWNDRQSGAKYTIHGLDFETGSLALDARNMNLAEPFDFTLSFGLQSSSQAAIKADVRLESTLELMAGDKRARLDPVDLSIELQNTEDTKSDGQPLTGSLAMNGLLKADWGKGLYEFSGLHLTGTMARPGPRKLEASLELTADLGADVAKTLATVRNLDLQAQAEGKTLPGGEASAGLTADAFLDWKNQALDIKGLKLAAYGLEAAGNVSGSGVFSEPDLRLDLSLAEFSPRALLQRMGIAALKTSDPDVLTAARADMRLNYSPQAVSVTDLALVLDDTTLKGRSRISDFSDPAIGFDLTADVLNVDRYLPPKSDTKAGEKQEKGTKEEGDGPPAGEKESTEPLRTLDAQGTVKVGRLTVKNIKMRNARLTITAKDGIIDIEPLSSQLYGGSLTANARLDARSDKIKQQTSLQLTDMNLTPFIKDALGRTLPLSGATTLKLDATSSGDSLGANINTLTGKGLAAMKNGKVQGFALIPQRFTPQGYNSARAAEATSFRNLATEFVLEEGVAKARDILLQTGDARALGRGAVDLAARSLNLDLKVLFEDYAPLPVKLTGSWFDPSVKLDTRAFLKGQAQKELKQELDKTLEKNLGEDLKKNLPVEEKAKDLLKGLF